MEKTNYLECLPSYIITKHGMTFFDWKRHYKDKDETFKKLWPEIQQGITKLELEMIRVPIRSGAIDKILKNWFPDLFLVPSIPKKDFNENKKQELRDLVGANESGIEV